MTLRQLRIEAQADRRMSAAETLKSRIAGESCVELAFYVTIGILAAASK